MSKLYNQMSDKEEEFPFEEFVEALSDDADLKKAMRSILNAASQRNAYWIYSAISTLVQILRSKDEDPSVKCRCLQAATILLITQQYPVVTLAEVYLLPILQQAALFRSKKSDELASYYFQQACGVADSPQIRKDSLQYLQRATELIFYAAMSKPYRTVEVVQLKQPSLFAVAASQLQNLGLRAPQAWKWIDEGVVKRGRKEYLSALRRFQEDSQVWAQFLLVNLLEEVKSGKKELLELRQLLSYGENFLTSPVINVCEDQLSDIADNFQQKRRYLGLLNQLVRNGDIQAIIMIKNSEFLPAIAARIGALPGHLGVAQGQNIFPQVQASKQLKRDFYCDFLRSLQNWAKAMPKDYDAQEFNICGIYRFLKQQKKFKFPDNLVLARYQKQAKENLLKNQQRNEKLIQILQQTTSRQHSLSAPFSRSNLKNQPTTTLSAQALQVKLQQAQQELKDLMVDASTAENALNKLIIFKDNWIGYLQALNLEEADEEMLEAVVSAGEKCVEQIQLIVPLGTAFTKGKLTHKEFKQRIAQSLDFHHQVSKASNLPPPSPSEHQRKSISISLLRNSHLNKSKQTSKIAGRDLLSRMKQKSRMRSINPLNISKAIDRSSISKYTDRSRAQRSKFTDRSKVSKLHPQQIIEKSRINEIYSNIPQKRSEVKEGGTTQPREQKLASSLHQPEQTHKSQHKESNIAKSYRSEQAKQKMPSINPSKMSQKPLEQSNSKRISRVRSKEPSQVEPISKVAHIQDYQSHIDPTNPPLVRQSSSRKSSSKILLRRSHGGSRLEHSRDSAKSDKDSLIKDSKAGKDKLVQNSSLSRTKKVSQIQSQLRKNIQKGDQTIELNGNVIRQGSLNYKKERSVKKESAFNDFHDGHREISSIIHSSQTYKEFHNSAQKIFNTIKKEPDPRPHPESSIMQPQSPMQLMAQSKSRSQNQQKEEDQQQNSNDMIENPDLAPMRHSFHQQSKLKSPSKLGENPQFKQVFANKYEGIEARQRQQKLLRNNQGLKNIIKTSKPKASYSKDSIMYQLSAFDRKLQSEKQLQSPRMHVEYGGTYQSNKDIQFQALQQKKNNEIALLREKIRELQMQTMSMRTKLVAKDNQLRSIKSGSVAGSQRNFQFTSPGQSNYDRTSHSHSRSQKGSLRGSSVGKRKESTLFQKQVESGYKQYLQRIKGTTFRKSLLKQKCLIHKSDELEIGCLSQSGETVLQATLYVTPHRFDLTDVSLVIQSDSNLRVKASPEQVKLISSKKQQKVHITIEILKLPFCLPELQINYKSTSQYASNYHRLTLPLAFNKFCSIGSILEVPQTHLAYLRTDDFKFNIKVGKLQRLSQSFSGYAVLPPIKDRPQWLVMGRCIYSSSRFSICLNLSDKNSWIEGFLLQGDPIPMRFFICTLKEILDASKK